MPDNIDSLQMEISVNAAKALKQLQGLSGSLKSLQSALSGISSGQFQNLSGGILQLSNSMKQFSSSVKTTDFTRIATGLNKLSSVNIQGVSDASRAINALVSNLSQIQSISFDSQGIANIANSIAQLGRKTVTQAVANIPLLTSSLKGLVSNLDGISTSQIDVSGLSQLASVIRKMGGKSATAAASGNITKLASALKQMMVTLSSAPKVSQNLIQMTQALGQLASSGARAGTASLSLSRSFGGLPSATKKAKSSFNGLAAAIGKFYATWWLAIRAINQFKKAIDISSNLTEVQNVVDVTFGNMSDTMNQFAKSALQNYGMSELAAKEIGSRFQAMGTAMDLSTAQAKKAFDFLRNNGTIYDESADSIADMSIELTKLAADMSSFYNIDQEEVARSLQSIYTGETEPLRKYGLDLTNATVQEWAMKHGLDAKMKSMTNAQKTMLRYQYVMANSAAAQNDFARTSGTWANQLRLLTGSFEQLGAIVGGVLINAFKPFIQALNKVMAAVINFAQVVSDALGAIFGWKYESGGGIADDLEAGSSAADDLDDAMGGAADKAKKLKNYTLGIDELNILEPDDGSDSGSGGGAGGAGGAGANASGGKWEETESLWEKYTSDIDSLYELGEYIGDTLTKALKKINWDSVYKSAENFGSGLAEFLNGLISPELFGALGDTIAGALNTVLHGLDSFGEKFDWKNFGESIATGINNFFKRFDFKLLANTFNTWATGILDTIITAIRKTRWDLIGSQIGTFLEQIDFIGIGSKIGIAIWEAINAGISFYIGMFSAAPIETTILTALAAIKISTSTISFLADIGNKIKNIKTGLSELSTFLNSGSFLASATPIALVASAIGVLALGLYNMEKNWKKEMADQFVEFQEDIGSNVPAMKESSEALDKLSDSTKKIIDSADEEVSKLDGLKTSYFELADQTTLTKNEQEKLKEYSQQLINQCPILAQAIDGVTGKYTAQKEEIEKLIEAQQKQMMADAYKEAMQEYTNELTKANVQLGIAEQKQQDNATMIGKLEQATESMVGSGEDLNVWAIENKELLNELGVAFEEGSFSADDLGQRLSFYRKEQEELAQTTSELSGKVGEANEDLNAAKAAYENYSNGAREAMQSSTTFQQSLRDLNTDLSNLDLRLDEAFVEGLAMDNFDTSKLKGFFDSLANDVPASAAQLQQAFTDIGLSLPNSLAESLAQQEASVQDSAVKTLMSMQSGIEIEKPELIQLFSDLGLEIPSGLVENLSVKGSEIQNHTIDLLLQIKSGYSQEAGNLTQLFSGLGIALPNELITSLTAEGVGADVQLAAIELLGKIKTASDSERGPLIEEYNSLGVGVIDEGIVAAMNSSENQENVKNATESMINNGVKNVISDSGEPLYNEGKDSAEQVGAGFADGMEKNESTTQEPVTSWVNSITNWFKELLGIHSPSTVFKEYGKNAVEGLNSGINENYSDTEKPVNDWVKNILDWFAGNGTKINSSTFGNFANNVITGFNNLVNSNYIQSQMPISSWVSGILSWFNGGEEDGKINGTTFGKFASGIVVGFSNKIGSDYENTKGNMETWASKIKEWFWGDSEQSEETGLGSKFKDFGTWIMTGLKNGLESMWDVVKDLISDIADSINDLMEKEEEIGSPSKRFFRYGAWMMEGLENGLSDGSKSMMMELSTIAQGIPAQFELISKNVSVNTATPYSGLSVAPLMASSIGVSERSYSDDNALARALGTIFDTKLIPVMQSANTSRDELLQTIADKDTNTYLDGRRVNRALNNQQARSGYSIRR